MVIYTIRGDKGNTSLYEATSSKKSRISKKSSKIIAIGTIDEFNSFLGVTISFSENPELTRRLKEVQRDLLTIGSILAGSNLRFFKTNTTRLEKVIDEIEGRLPPLKNFILPGGSRVASQLQFARTMARRAEREVVSLSEVEPVKPQILMYLNRLSDYLFMLARDTNYQLGAKEEVWVG